MTVQEAARALAEAVSGRPWLVSVGTGHTERGDTIYLYVDGKCDWHPADWFGFPVRVVNSGRFIAMAGE
jgi:hypothetical protein